MTIEKAGKTHLPPNLATLPTLGPGEMIGEGDTFIHHHLLPQPDTLFHQLLAEVKWQTMTHITSPVPRLVCVQGAIDENDGSQPIYRHPTDRTVPLMHFSPAIVQVCQAAEKVSGGQVFNHALIQLYRSGEDNISEHADKTLDIKHGSVIVNVSLGARRTMRLREKGSEKTGGEGGEGGAQLRRTQRVHMPHNSLFVLGLKTNARWLHGIMPDRRRDQEKDEEEVGFGGIRISVTLRSISTWLMPRIGVNASQITGTLIYGQGAVSKHRDHACPTIDADEAATASLIKAFSRENRTLFTDQDWQDVYGAGFDVVNFVSGGDGGHGKGVHGNDIFSSESVIFYEPSSEAAADSSSCLAAEIVEYDHLKEMLDGAGVKYIVVPAPVLPSCGRVTGSENERKGSTESGLVMRADDRVRTEIRGAGAIRTYLSARFQSSVEMSCGSSGSCCLSSRDARVSGDGEMGSQWKEAAEFERSVVERDGRRMAQLSDGDRI